MKTNYIHLRYWRPVNTFEGVVYDIESRGGLTIAYELDKDESELYISYAKCSRRDNFNKKIGRAIAKGRLDAMQFTAMGVDLAALEGAKNYREQLHQLVVGSLVQILPEEASADFLEMVAAQEEPIHAVG